MGVATDRAFDACALDKSYAFLDAVPDALFEAVVAFPEGSLEDRVSGLVGWRTALLQARLPDAPVRWPAGGVGEAVRTELAELGLARFCRDQPELVDSILKDILESAAVFRPFVAKRRQELLGELRKIEEERQRSKVKLADLEAALEGKRGRAQPLSGKTLRRLSQEAGRRAEEDGLVHARALIRQAWAGRVRIWSEVEEVFGELGDLLGRGRDLAKSVLRHHGWREVVGLSALLKRCPELKELMRVLGRLQQREDENVPAVMERIFTPVRRSLAEWREVRSPYVPHEVRGLTRSDDLSRMIPAEALLLLRPALKRLWHAHRIEHALLTYRVEGVMAEKVEREDDVMEERERPQPRKGRERGPIIVCLDTSGSMHGAPEVAAKALVLEAMRVAHAEGRLCYLYAFSGPRDVAERELKLTEDGVVGLLDFLACSFHGGTDVAEPLRRACARLDQGWWQGSDILLVSDGEFTVPRATLGVIPKARAEKNCKLHGVLVGSFQSLAMEQLCDVLHRFSGWSLQDGN